MKKITLLLVLLSAATHAQTLKTSIDASVLNQGNKGITALKLRNTLFLMVDSIRLKPTKISLGLGNVENTADINKPISSATQIALNSKENTLTKGNITSTDLTVTGGTGAVIGTGVGLSISNSGRQKILFGAGDVTNSVSLTANIGDLYINTTSKAVYKKTTLSFPSGLTYIVLPDGSTWVKLGNYYVSKADVGLANADNTSDVNKPVSTATNDALILKENILTKGNITSTDLTVTGGTGAVIGTGVGLSISNSGRQKIFYGTTDITNAVSITANVGDLYINTTTKAVYEKSVLSFPSGLSYIVVPDATWVKLGNFSLTKSDVGLANVDNTSDANKPISTDTQIALNAKENTLTKGNVTSTDLTVTGGTNAIIGSGVSLSLNNSARQKIFYGTTDITNAVSITANVGDLYINTTTKAVYEKSVLSFPSGLSYIVVPDATWVKLGNFSLTKSDVGLANVDNTTDVDKPVSTATLTALDSKLNTSTAATTYAPLATPTFVTNIKTPLVIGGTGATSTLVYKTTTGVGAFGADHIFQVGNNGATEAMRILNNTNVGIGTASPAAKTHIYGTGEAIIGGITNAGSKGASIYLQDNGTAAYSGGSVLFGASQGIGSAIKYEITDGTSNSKGDLTFQVRPNTSDAYLTTAMQIKSSGNVGIGIVSPQQKLHVAGYGKFDSGLIGGSTGLTMYGSESSTNGMFLSTVGNFAVGGANTSYRINTLSSAAGTSVDGINISVTDATASNTHTSKFFTQQQGGGIGRTLFYAASNTTGATQGQFDILTENGSNFLSQLGTGYNSSTNTLTLYDLAGVVKNNINTNGNSFFNGGNVGIGTTSPNKKLEISNAGEASIRLNNTSANYWDIANTTPSGTLDFVRGGATHISVGNTGNVGFGTTNPLEKQTIVSSSADGQGIYRDYDVTAGAGGVYAYMGAKVGSTITPSSAIFTLLESGGSTGSIQFQTRTAGALSTKMYIGSTGHIGIGTTSPQQSLHVVGNTPLRLERTSVGYFENAITVANTGSNADLTFDAGQASSGFVFRTRNAGNGEIQALNIDRNGYIGMGTSSPTKKLTVASPSGDYGQYIYGNGAAGLNNGILIDAGLNASDYGLRVRSGTSSEYFSVRGDGNVGVGTASPTQKLDVSGTVNATQYKISALNTAPATATSTGTLGEVRITATYIYVCTATNTWVRTALATF